MNYEQEIVRLCEESEECSLIATYYDGQTTDGNLFDVVHYAHIDGRYMEHLSRVFRRIDEQLTCNLSN
jgi:hypothetical protein